MDAVEVEESGTDLYQRMMVWASGEGEMGKSLAGEWAATPWMVDARTGSSDDTRAQEIWSWCRETFGQESRPMIAQEGLWKRGNVTLYGYTWVGFATETLMQKFCDVWL